VKGEIITTNPWRYDRGNLHARQRVTGRHDCPPRR